jgi:hypothetical protein
MRDDKRDCKERIYLLRTADGEQHTRVRSPRRRVSAWELASVSSASVLSPSVELVMGTRKLVLTANHFREGCPLL